MLAALDGLIKQSIGKISTRTLLALSFSFLLLFTITVTSYLLIKSGNRIVSDVIAETAERISRDLSREVTRLLDTPNVVNLNGARSILSDRIDYKNDDSLTSFFMDAPQRRAEYSVSSMYFAEPNGRFVGVEVGGHRQGLDAWSISISSEKTDGMYTDYSVNPDGSVGQLLGEVKPYDPRVRSWYKRAIATPDRAVWSDVYTDFDTKLATLTRAQAVLDADGKLIGVLGVDLFLEHIQSFLSTLGISANSEAFIYNSEGVVLAAHAPAYTGNLPSHNLLVAESPFKYLPAAVNVINGSENSRGQAGTVELNDEQGYLYSAAIGQEHGVNWTLGVYIPNSDFLQSVDEHVLKLAPLAVLGLVLFGAALVAYLSVVIRPLEELRVSANKIASGNFDTPIDTSMGNEVGALARSIDSMQKDLQKAFIKLESNFQEISQEKCRVDTTLRSIAEGVISIDTELKIIYMNPAAQLLTGWSLNQVKCKEAAQVLNVQYIDAIKQLNTEGVEKILRANTSTEIQGLQLVHKSGGERPISFSIAPTISENGMNHGSVIVFSDLTEKNHMTSELIYQATHDDLTGLVNRREFEQQLNASIKGAKQSGSTDTLLYIDLDQFKVVNDTCGHIAGDELLRQIAATFKQCVRLGDVVARMGGDEFGVLLKHCSSDAGMQIAENLLANLAKFRFDWEQRSFRVGASIGLTTIDSDAASVGLLLSDADSACYRAKESGRNRIHQFHENDDSINQRRQEMSWVDKIHRAMDLDKFVLYTQLIVPMSKQSDAGVHFEVLLRMLDDNDEIIPPGMFLPAAERYNLAANIDRWVIENTFKWLSRNPGFVSTMGVCSINMSGQSIGDAKFTNFIIGLLDNYQIPPNKICFEVTETTTIANLSNAINIIDTLRGRGCKFALDDFGTGLSSFEYLKNLRVDYLKIDGVFVRDIMDNKYDEAIVNSINDIGQTLGLLTVAEFVENQQLMDKLEEIGLDYVQGFGVSKPQPIDELLGVQLKRSA